MLPILWLEYELYHGKFTAVSAVDASVVFLFNSTLYFLAWVKLNVIK